MIGRNTELQNILSKLSGKLGDYLSGDNTLEEMRGIAERHGKDDFLKAIQDPDMKAVLDKLSGAGRKQDTDSAIISKYLNLHRDLVRFFQPGLDDPIRKAVEDSFLKGFYAGAQEYATKAPDIVSSARRMSEAKERIKWSQEAIELDKKALKAAFSAVLGDLTIKSAEAAEIFRKIDAGELQALAAEFPDFSAKILASAASIERHAIRQELLRKTALKDFFEVTAKRRKHKEIKQWEMGEDKDEEPEPSAEELRKHMEKERAAEEPEDVVLEGEHPMLATPDTMPGALIPETEEEKRMTREELEESRRKKEYETSWKEKGKELYYHTEEGETVSGLDIVHKARAFVAKAFNAEIKKLEPKAEKLVSTAIQNVAKAITASIEMSPETKAEMSAPPEVEKLSLAELDEEFADKANGMGTSSAKTSDRDKADSIIQSLIDSQDGVLYNFAHQEASNIASANHVYQAWAEDVSREINRYQGGASYHKKKAAKEPDNPAEKSFRRYVNELNWSPLAQVVIDKIKDPKALPPPETREVDLTEDWASLSKEYYKKYRESVAAVADINKRSNDLYNQMEAAKRRWKQGDAPRKEYYKAKLEFNKMMEELIAAVAEMDQYEGDPLLYPPSEATTQMTHSHEGTRGNPLFNFISSMFGIQILNMDDAKKYVELLSNGRAVVRASVLKAEFMNFFSTKLTEMIYTALYYSFKKGVDEKLKALYSDVVLSKVEEQRAEEELEAEQKKLEEEQRKKERRERPQPPKEPSMVQPGEEEEEEMQGLHEDLPPPPIDPEAYGSRGHFPPGMPTEEEE